MKKFLSLFLFSCIGFTVSAIVFLIDPSITINPLSPSVICSDGTDTLVYSVSSSSIPPNTNVVVYQSTDSTFNPYLGQGDSIGYVQGDTASSSQITSTCPKILGIFIDACNDSGRLEPANEYMVITSGQGFRAANLKIDLPNTNLRDINTGSNPCSFGTPSNALMTLLRTGFCNSSNLIAASQADSIPPNALVIVFTGAGTDYPYNLSRFCQTGQKVYILQNSCTNGSGAFVNNDAAGTTCSGAAAGTRYRTTTLSNRNCFDELTYDRCGLNEFDGANPNANDGNYVIRLQNTDTSSVANGGIQNNAADRCNGIVLDTIIKTKILKYAIPQSQCNTGKHFIKAITHPNGTQPISNSFSYQLICNDVRATSTTTNICSGDSVKIGISSTDPNATFSWTTSGGTGITGQASGTGNTIKQLLTYSGTTKDSLIYNITSNDAGCTKTTSVKVVVNKCTVCVPNFTAPDTVCLGTSVTINNLTTCGASYDWNFCKQELIQGATGNNLGAITGMPTRPVSIQIFKEGVNWIGFVGNDAPLPGTPLRRLNFGTSLNNIPTATSLPTFNQLAIPRIIRFIKEGTDWYAIVISGRDNNASNYQGCAILFFGNSLLNTPTLYKDLGNLGGLIGGNESMSGVSLEKSGNNVIAIVSTFEGVANSGNIYRINFGTSITNLNPTKEALGNFGVFTRLNTIKFIENRDNWYGFAANDGYPNNPTNDKLYRLDFGTSLLNTPTVVSLGNPSGKTNRVSDLLLYNDCESLKLLGANYGSTPNDLISFQLPNGITSNNLSATSFGNIGSLNSPGSFSQVLIENGQKYVFITNANNSTISRINIEPVCSSIGISSSTQFNPPVFTADSLGTITVSLTIDKNLPTELSTCQEIVVINNPKPDARINQISCATDSIRLSVANVDANTTYSWTGPNGFTANQPRVSIKFNSPAQEGDYIVTSTGFCGAKKDTVSFVTPNLQLSVSGSGEVCNGSSVTLTANGQFDSVRWSNGTLGNQNTVTVAGDYTAFAYLNGCNAATTVRVTQCQQQICNPTITGNKEFCQGDSIILDAGTGFTSYLWNTGAITQTIVVKTTGKFIVNVTGQSCTGKDSVQAISNPLPTPTISGNTSFCNGGSTILTVNGQYDSVRWSTNATTTSITVTQAGNYSVTVYNKGCSGSANVDVTAGILNVSISGDNVLCGGTTGTLTAIGTFDSVRWNTNATTTSINITQSGTYSVTAYSNSSGCSGTASYNVARISIDYFLDKKLDSICTGDTAKFILSAGDLGSSPVDTFSFTQPGRYLISYQTPNCGLFTDSVVVLGKSISKPTITGNLSICQQQSTTLDAGANYDSYAWQPNGEITQTIVASQPGTYTVTVKKGNCSSSNAVTVVQTPSLNPFSLGNDTAFCGNFSKVLSTGNQTTVWSTDVTAAQITVTQAGQIIATISNNCNTVSDTIVITQNSIPSVFIGNDTAFCDGELLLSAPSEMRSYIWNNGSTGQSITVTQEGTYSVKITDGNNCSNSDSITITSNCLNDIWIPNAFSPNNDGVNDVFMVRGNPQNTTIEKMLIYNRWGNKVFEANNILPNDKTTGWNGTYKGADVPFEVYGYYVVAKFKNGEKQILKGNVTVVK